MSWGIFKPPTPPPPTPTPSLLHPTPPPTEMLPKAIVAQHSTAMQAGAFAARIRAKNLVLTHFSARWGGGGG